MRIKTVQYKDSDTISQSLWDGLTPFVQSVHEGLSWFWESSVSYKHNNLMAIRKNYWCDDSLKVQQEKTYLKSLLEQQHIFSNMQESDLEYFFFSLPSEVIVKGYALGFMHQRVKDMLLQYMLENKSRLAKREVLKVKYRA